MNNFIIRSAQISDSISVAELARQLGYPTRSDEAAIRLGNLLNRPDHAIFVATTRSGEVIGWIHIYELSLLEMQPTAEIGGLIIDQAQRSLGVGQALVKAAEDWSAKRGHSTIWVHSNTIRSDAHRFYARLGFNQIKTQAVFMKVLETIYK